MSFLLAQILRALVRLEKKLDELLVESRALMSKATLPTIRGQLDNANQICPLCQRPVTYQPVIMKVPDQPGITMEVMVRVCGCEPRATQQPIPGDFQ